MSAVGLSVSPESLAALLAFLLAIVVIDAFEISLPRGDSIGVAGALVAASVVLFGFLPALALGIAAVLLSQVARRLLGVGTSLAGELAVRIAATLSAGAVLWALVRFASAFGGIVAVPAAYLLTELVCRQALLAMRGKRSLKRLLAGNFSRRGCSSQPNCQRPPSRS